MSTAANKPGVAWCTYREGGRRCPRRGYGDPPRCAIHELLEEEEDEEDGGALARIGRQAGEMLDDRLAGTSAGFLRGIGEFLGSVAGRRAEVALEDRINGMSREDVEAYLAQVRQRVHNIRRRLAQERAQREQSGQRPQAKTGSDGLTAREILGFSEDAQLTREMVQKRRRELAKVFHPDKNPGSGSPAQMQRVNAAAKEILAEL